MAWTIWRSKEAKPTQIPPPPEAAKNGANQNNQPILNGTKLMTTELLYEAMGYAPLPEETATLLNYLVFTVLEQIQKQHPPGVRDREATSLLDPLLDLKIRDGAGKVLGLTFNDGKADILDFGALKEAISHVEMNGDIRAVLTTLVVAVVDQGFDAAKKFLICERS
jgi:hypothetical protein